jgi:uncharacterized protein YbjT (DUF2867 family)
MTQHEGLILVLGGTGKTGSRVAVRLAAQDAPTRLGSRAADPPFDWEDEGTWDAALDGVRSVWLAYQPDIGFPGGAERVAAFTARAVAADVRRLVLLSGRNEPEAQLAEQVVQGAGVEWTIVRSSFFAQNFSEAFFLEQVLEGVVAFPAGDTVEAFIDIEDIADIAAEALLTDRHVGRLYEVSGPHLLTFGDAVVEIGEAAGRDIAYVALTGEEFATALTESGMPPEEVTAYVDLFTMILDGRSEYLADGVQQALGREPRDFRTFARETAATGVWDVPASVGS